MITNFDTVPQILRDRDQWVCWRHEKRDGKWTKIPYNAKSGNKADTTDLNTWSSFDAALERCSDTNDYDGIGYVFNDDFIGIDLDEAIENGVVKPWAQEIIDGCPSYAEISPSRTGDSHYHAGFLAGQRY